MLGWINRSVKEFILTSFGAEAWEAILAKYPHDSKWRSQCPYSDSLTVDLVVTAATHLGVPVEQALEAYGVFFFSYVESLGYKKLIQILGNTLFDFLQNLNNLHLLLQFSFPEMISPAFKCKTISLAPPIVQLTYSSARQGLFHIVFGIVKETARRLYDYEVNVVLISEETLPGNHFQYVMDISVKGEEGSVEGTMGVSSRRGRRESVVDPSGARIVEHMKEPLTLTVDLFFQMFPFAIFMDRKCEIMSTSPSLHRMTNWNVGDTLSRHFSIVHPRGLTFDVETLLDLARMRTAFVMKLLCNGLELKGQFVDIAAARRNLSDLIIAEESEEAEEEMARVGAQAAAESQEPADSTAATSATPPSAIPSRPASCPYSGPDHGRRSSIFSDNGHGGASIVFICSPRVRSLEDMRKYKVFMSDMPLHDSCIDMVMLSEQRSAEAELSQRIESLNLQLEEERKRSDRLLYQMLPVNVADSLRTGTKVNAQHHPDVTILFSDIVGFTTISAKTAPENVFRLLDDLYTALDNELATSFPELYKVETIGDAYMVVGNLTSPCPDHADRMIHFASRMLAIAETIESGVPDMIVQLRVGLHSGSVVAGVVGKKMPSFCLFGDTVNTASRMESLSVAGCIHISDACRRAIRNEALVVLEPRGEIAVKGKGVMSTHFVTPRAGDSVPQNGM